MITDISQLVDFKDISKTTIKDVRIPAHVLIKKYKENKDFWFRGSRIRILKIYMKATRYNREQPTIYFLLSDSRIIQKKSKQIKDVLEL